MGAWECLRAERFLLASSRSFFTLSISLRVVSYSWEEEIGRTPFHLDCERPRQRSLWPTHHPRFLLFQEFDHVQVSLLFIVTVHIVFVLLVPLFGFLKVVLLLLHNVLKRKKALKTVTRNNLNEFFYLTGWREGRWWINGLWFPLVEPIHLGLGLTSNSRSLVRKFFSSQWYSNISGGPTDFSVASSNSVFDILANSPTFS